MSVLQWLVNVTRSRLAEIMARPERHAERVTAVQDQVRLWYESHEDERRPMCTARSNWQNLSTRFVNKDLLHRIELGSLRDILEVNAPPGERGTVRVEPSVTVGYITRRLAPTHMLAICLELEDATLGGATPMFDLVQCFY